LSRAALETLAIVAYRQPIMRVEIETLRGVDCGGVLRLLLERRLIRVMGRKEIPGRPLIYGTTRQFLEAFELRDLKDLPTLREILELAPETPGTDRPPKAPQDGKNP
jgi:segregation and condensation protein B